MSDKETAPHFQVPPDHATREELIGALEYWVIRAKTAERVAAECTAPAPQPALRDCLIELYHMVMREAEGLQNVPEMQEARRMMKETYAAATPQVTAELELEQEADGRWLAAFTRFPGVAAYGPSKEEAIRNVAKVLIESEQASPTPDTQAYGPYTGIPYSGTPPRNTGVSLDGGKTIHSKFKND